MFKEVSTMPALGIAARLALIAGVFLTARASSSQEHQA